MNSYLELIEQHLQSAQIFNEDPPWTIQLSDVSGRGIFASRDLEEGVVIFIDAPLLLGPRYGKTDKLICVICYKENGNACTKNCGLPVCSNLCENSARHKRECQLISNWNATTDGKINLNILKSLTPIRGLLLNHHQRELLKYLKSHHKTQGIEVDSLREHLKGNLNETEENLMNFVCSILDTNAFEIFVGSEESQTSLRAIYPLGSLMNHNCTPNITYYFDDQQHMIVKTTQKISKGQEIYNCYTKLLWGTCTRRQFLLKTKQFICNCARCQDVTEFGTYLSALKCLKCEEIVLPFYSNKFEITWKCIGCEEVIANERVAIILCMLGTTLKNLLCARVEDISEALKGHLLKYLPKSNEIFVQLKYRVIWLIGHVEHNNWHELSLELIQEKERYCRELLELLEKLGAGQSKMRGLLLYELYSCLKELQKRRQETGENNNSDDVNNAGVPNEMNNLLNESRGILCDDVHAPLEIKELNK